ncbi:ArsA family ATPase [Bhargavaea cecembensis]|uniref:ArsA family ATPase n=1 Tax=Bhargavaea cecembensis TaxID=394098 RepID=UPI00059069C1|nr:ArsA family ATPase [Bhargavaea cecembensis]
MDVLKKEVIFVGGKGGVGKSTSAAAIALRSANEGFRTLLVSTDPAHNIGDIFGKKLTGGVSPITDRLSALEIDPERETELYIGTVKANLKDVVHAGTMDEVNRQLDTAKASPGADEAALFDKLVTILLEEKANFDRIVFDTAPTGHTIRLLTLPELMGVWISGLLEKRKKTNENYSALLNDGEPVEDPIYDVLRERQSRFSRVRDIMLDNKKTGFIFVLNPERLPILETDKAVELLGKYGLDVKTLIVNKVLPDEADGEFLKERRRHEQRYLAEIDRVFGEREIIRVPLFPRDITTLDDLDAFSKHFKAGGRNESIRI